MTLEEFYEQQAHRLVRHGECLIWTGPLSSGYPKVRLKLGDVPYDKGQRIVLALKLGRHLRWREHARHLCHTPACLEAEHIVVGNQKKNVWDSILAGRPGVWTSKLTEEQVREIRQTYVAKKHLVSSQHVLAKKYGVCQRTINNVLHMRSPYNYE